jgi:hypothetical protein
VPSSEYLHLVGLALAAHAQRDPARKIIQSLES